MKITIQRKINDARYVEALELIHRAFDEHLKNGIEFTCSSFTLDDLKNKTKDGYITTVTSDDGRLQGFHFFSIRGTIAHEEFLAVRPDCKRCGVASKMLSEEIKFLTGYKSGKAVTCMIGDTSIHAISSVRWHVGNGYKIIGLASFGCTNYYSYIFRRQLTSPSVWNSRIWCAFHYACSWLLCKSTKNKNGTLTALGKILKTAKNKIYK